MINHLLLVKNVGKLNHMTSTKSVQFSGLNVIYAGNGYGKTTLAAILRSLKSGEAIHITERKTLGSSDPQEVVLETDRGNHVFQRGSWSTRFKDIEIFDSAFISSNVYEGRSVDHEHKKNLCNFILGSEGVRLAREVDRLDEEIRSLTNRMAEVENKILRYIVGSISVKDFVALQTSNSVDTDIYEKEAQIDSLKKAGDIATRAALLSIRIPELPLDELRSLLSKTLAHVSKDAEHRMREHIHQCMDEDGERWLQQGMVYAKAKLCPFCSGNLDGNDLFKSYESFFDEAYRQLKADIQTFSQSIDTLLSQDDLSDIQGAIATNNTRAEFWKNHVSGQFPFLRVEDIGNSWQSTVNAIQAALSIKAGAPLDIIPESDQLWHHLDAYSITIKKVLEYDEKVTAHNHLIEMKKNSIAVCNLSQAQTELQLLQSCKKRGEPVASNLCKEYSELDKTKKSREQEKSKARKELTNQAESMLIAYQVSINQHLSNCGAGFSIADTKPSYQGGRASTQYFLKINECIVELAKPKDNSDSAWFGNTLSDGDKSTLAFAFFIAKLENDVDLAHKVVVFDDPLTSLDRNRRVYTTNQVLAIKAKAKQILVLTHDPFFARSLCKDTRGSDALMLELKQIKSDTTLCKCDIDRITQDDYFRDYCILKDYVYDGLIANPEDIQRRIRPVIEGNLKFRFPGAFRSNHTLGSMIKSIREADTSNPINAMQGRMSELEDFNDYSQGKHHNDPETASELIDETELKTYVKRALDFVTG